MENNFVDHVFSKIIEGKDQPELSLTSARSKLQQVKEVAEKIRLSQGGDAVQNILGYKEVERALLQCIDFVDNPESQVTEADFYIYESYAKSRLKKAEEVIDSELQGYGF
jgi:hypothetical protein